MITRYVYPFRIRERISNLFDKYLYKNRRLNDLNVSLTFNKSIKLDLKSSDVGHREIIFNGFCELELSKKLTQLAKSGGVLVDVGANYGYFSCLWAAAKTDNSVIAFEANPENIRPLTSNVERNNFRSNILIRPTALGREIGQLKFYLGSETGQTGWGGLMPNGVRGTIEVPVDTLDNFAAFNKLEKIDVLKIDTEGADTWIIYGAARMLKGKRIRHIFFESNVMRMQQLDIRPGEAEKFLMECGYTVNMIAENEYHAYLS
jgi:FkbM family methyltransferase